VIRIYYGPDTLSRSEELQRLKRTLDADGMLESNTTVLDGATVSPEELRNHCNTVPFLASTRLVIVDGLLKRTERRRGGGRTAPESVVEEDSETQATPTDTDGLPAWRFLREFGEQMPPSTELVLVDEDVSPANQFVRDMKPVAEVRLFALPGRNELPDWIRKRAADKGLDVNDRLASGIAELAGPDLWALDHELEKLATYVGDGPVPGDAELLGMLSVSREQSVFAFCDQIVEGRKTQALASLARLLADGESPQYVMSMITRQLRLITLAREGLDERLNPGMMMDRLDTRSQYVVDKTTQQARRFSLPLLARFYQRIVRADSDTKTGLYEGDVALQLLVADLAGAVGR
jgi:DNA polymerase III subunit delta